METTENILLFDEEELNKVSIEGIIRFVNREPASTAASDFADIVTNFNLMKISTLVPLYNKYLFYETEDGSYLKIYHDTDKEKEFEHFYGYIANHEIYLGNIPYPEWNEFRKFRESCGVYVPNNFPKCFNMELMVR
jgi:hypothetical protein